MSFEKLKAGALTYQDVYKRQNKFNNYDSLISYKLGFHAEYTTSKEKIQGVAKLAEKYKAPVYMHASETKSEVEECVKKYGKTPTQLFNDLGIWNYGGGAYHSVWVNDDDLQIYKDKNVWAIINAGSNCKLASGIAPVQKMYDKNINVAIGTDGPASNNLSLIHISKENGKFTCSDNIEECVKDADIVYTDVWASMGQENEKEERNKIFKEYQINEKFMSLAKPCLLYTSSFSILLSTLFILC